MQIFDVLPEARNLDTNASVATSMVLPSGENGVEVGAEVSVVRERGRVRDDGCGAEVRCGRGAQPQWSEVRNGRRSVLLLFLHHHYSLCAARQFGEATSHQFPLNYKSIAPLSLSRSESFAGRRFAL